MSLIQKLSNVIKEVFWIKSSNKKKTTLRRKAVKKKSVVKKKTAKKLPKQAQKSKIVKPQKSSKSSQKPPKSLQSATVKIKKIELDPNLNKVGEITHYFDRIKVCVVKITQGTVLIGDKLTFVGKKIKFMQKVWSMQIESQDVKIAKKGQLIGLKVDKLVEVGDIVYK